jgi:spermidine/putrescine transport system permease protein
MTVRWRIAVLMLPPILLLLVLFVFPMASMATFSFRQGTFGADRQLFTLENYRQFFINRSYQTLLWRSMWISLQTSLLAVVLAYPVAYFLAFQAGKRQLTWLTILIVPAWTSYLLRILAWKLMLSSGGLINSLLLQFHLIDIAQPLLLYNRSAVIVTLVYSWIPFVALPIFAALNRINRSLLEAASDLGSPPWKTFLRITLPLSLPGVYAGFFIVLIPTLGEWVTPALVGGVDGFMYGNLIQDQFVRALNWPMGSLMSFVMLGVVLVFLFLFSRVGHLSDLAGV